MAALAFANRSVVPLSLALAIKSTWYLRYSRSVVEHRSTLLGFFSLEKNSVQRGDSASIESMEDSMLLAARPRWYRLTLWSTALCRRRIVIKTNQLRNSNARLLCSTKHSGRRCHIDRLLTPRAASDAPRRMRLSEKRWTSKRQERAFYASIALPASSTS
jgi:hypothetical protein